MSRPFNRSHRAHSGGGSGGGEKPARLKARGLERLPALLPLASSGPAPIAAVPAPSPPQPLGPQPRNRPEAATRRGEGRAEGRAPPAECSSTSRPSSGGRSGPHPRAPSSRLTCSAAPLQRCLRGWPSARQTRCRRRPRPRPAPAPPRRRRLAPGSTSGRTGARAPRRRGAGLPTVSRRDRGMKLTVD